jgi:sterol O-acyltransferase
VSKSDLHEWNNTCQISGNLSTLWDLFWVSILGIYYICSFVLVSYIAIVFELPFASSLYALGLHVFFFMKIHSFIRSNSPKVITISDDKLNIPKFFNYCYFLCLPTFLYRDTYPRTEKTNWRYVCFHLIQIFTEHFIFAFISRKFVIPSVQDFGRAEYTVGKILLRIFQNTVAGFLCHFLLFIFVLHSAPNLLAELTTFGDRFFYGDWWTGTDYSKLFYKWNIPVKDWLFFYIVKDCREYLFKGNFMAAKLTAFLFSAIIHEWLFSFIFGVFAPICFLLMIFVAIPLTFITLPKTAFFNVLFWLSLSFGASIILTTYSIEYFANINSPVENSTIGDKFIPRFLSCITIR